MAWRAWIISQPEIRWSVARSMPKTIDTINISNAANRAAWRAYKKTINTFKPHFLRSLKTLLDAGLKLPPQIPQKAIIKGDEKIPAIALASILAKTARDAYMDRAHKPYPAYKFKENKGYGTASHIQALKTHGPCPEHRLTFIKKFINL
jgi:ribonuclease HII